MEYIRIFAAEKNINFTLYIYNICTLIPTELNDLRFFSLIPPNKLHIQRQSVQENMWHFIKNHGHSVIG